MNSKEYRMQSAISAIITVALIAGGVGEAAASERRAPKLVLQITVDQLRADLPKRLLDRMGDRGFRYLYERGVVFEDAHHDHANTETIVGHTTLSTGAHPAVHGMVANVWFDRKTDKLVYNIEDSRYPLLSEDADVDDETEIDPTQRTASSSGRSPANIRVSTLSDELALHTNGRAKIFGVSVKDRGAVSMAGHAGKAYWFSKEAGAFVTSRFYGDRYPNWVTAWNERGAARRFSGKSWELLQPRSSYLHGDEDDMAWETDFPGFGRTFPHPYGKGDDKYFTTKLTLSPAGDALTLDFALELIENEAIGEDGVTDYLSISFSSTDYVGHIFGASSLEMEDNLLRLDRTLGLLLTRVDEEIGLENTLVVLSADHGSAEAPARLAEIGIEVDHVDPEKWDLNGAYSALERRFGVGKELIRKFFQPYLYLDLRVIREHDLEPAEVEQAVAMEWEKFDGVLRAVSSDRLLRGDVSDDAVSRAISNNHDPRRSGDVYIVFEPHRFINDLDGLTVAASHGSPWSYDSHVPIIFAGSGLKPNRVYRRVSSTDVATTLAAWIGAKAPSGATGQVLEEVVGRSVVRRWWHR
jgi:predicted AlkP superfamily pyrophosphatase or phosphodiesterase